MADWTDIVAYHVDGRPLTAEDVSNLKRNAGPARNNPTITIPRYKTDLPVTRDEIRELIGKDWGLSFETEDSVNAFLSENKLKPVGIIPMPPMRELTDAMTDMDRRKIFNDHEDQRSLTRRAREVFDINGVPRFVPASAFPDMNDPNEDRTAKADKINSLGKDQD
jgi:hypothetical protein